MEADGRCADDGDAVQCVVLVGAVVVPWRAPAVRGLDRTRHPVELRLFRGDLFGVEFSV